MTGVPERLRWAVQVVSPGPAEQLLEIGCGVGVAAALVCDQLDTGRLLGIDRSATAVARAARRNAHHVAAGRLELRQSSLSDLAVQASTFDRAFAVDVNLFWTGSAAAELRVLHEALRAGGSLHLLYGVGPTGPDRITGAVAGALAAAGFDGLTVVDGPAGFGLLARRP